MSGPGATASPVCSADQPQSSWAQSTIDSSMAPNDIENSSITVTAPAKLRARNRAGSTSGLLDRRQCSTNEASSTAAAASTSTVRADDQPQSPPSTRPRLSAPTPAVTRTAPSASGRGTGWPGASGSRNQPTTSAASPIGTLTRNTQRQLTATSRPPMTGPSAAAMPPVAVQVLTAPLRRSGEKLASTRLSEVGVSRAAPAACTSRNAISMATLVAAPQAAEAAVNTATPSRKPYLRRCRSASRPISTSSEA